MLLSENPFGKRYGGGFKTRPRKEKMPKNPKRRNPMQPISRALMSVTDKSGLVEFAKFLAGYQIEILSTGGTAKLLRDNGVPVVEVSDFTGFPEMLDGRVKTLHPKVHGGILAQKTNPDHVRQMQEHGIQAIDLVAVNLYAFEKTVANSACTLGEAIENIDIGGPSLIRAAAKNYQSVLVVVEPADYEQLLSALQKNDELEIKALKEKLAYRAFAHTAAYDKMIADYFGGGESLNLSFEKVCDLRYGENPHQKASFYADRNKDVIGIVNARQLAGKELSFNNIYDLHSGLEMAKELGAALPAPASADSAAKA